MENTFVWTEYLSVKFALWLRNDKEKHEKEHKSWRDCMDEFKAHYSKNPPDESDLSDKINYELATPENFDGNKAKKLWYDEPLQFNIMGKINFYGKEIEVKVEDVTIK